MAALVPHPPIILPQIGKRNTELLVETAKSYEFLAKLAKERKVDTFLIISPHGLLHEKTFALESNAHMHAHFKNFGDFSTVCEWAGDVGLAYRLRETLESSNELKLCTSPGGLDHGVSIPMLLLSKYQKKASLLPLYHSGLTLEDHYKIGTSLQREIICQKKNIAIIASGDLSHRLSRSAPAGYSSKGKKYDQKIIDSLKDKDFKSLIEIDENHLVSVSECGLRSILILLGVLDGVAYKTEQLSYEYPFGVGYLSMNFAL